jgi:hypothetical protein
MELLGDLNRAIGQVGLAFSAGLSRVAMIEVNSTDLALDTHSNHEKNHLRVQTQIWQQVSDIFELFKKLPYNDEDSLFDQTLFLVSNEFSRTPFLNSARGKDHNVNTNSFLVAGAGAPSSGAVIGGSRVIPNSQSRTGRARHVGRPFDFTRRVALSDDEMRALDEMLIMGSKVPQQFGLLTIEDVFHSIAKKFVEHAESFAPGRQIF